MFIDWPTRQKKTRQCKVSAEVVKRAQLALAFRSISSDELGTECGREKKEKKRRDPLLDTFLLLLLLSSPVGCYLVLLFISTRLYTPPLFFLSSVE